MRPELEQNPEHRNTAFEQGIREREVFAIRKSRIFAQPTPYFAIFYLQILAAQYFAEILAASAC
jgi:hypothetical protein